VRTSEFEYVSKRNTAGYRDDEWSKSDRSNRGNVVLLGSSFADGYGVSRENMWDLQIEQMALKKGRQIKVFNGSFVGADVNTAIEKFNDLASNLHVKARYVLLTMFTEQFSPRNLKIAYGGISNGRQIDKNARRNQTTWNVNLLRDLTLLKLLSGFVVSRPELVTEFIFLSNLTGIDLYGSRNEAQWICLKSNDKAETNVAAIKDAVLTLKRYFEDQDRVLLLAVIPSKVHCVHYKELNTGIYALEANIGKLKRAFAQIEVPTIFLIEPIVRENPNPGDLYYKFDNHFNANGYRFTSRQLYEFIVRSIPIPDRTEFQSGPVRDSSLPRSTCLMMREGRSSDPGEWAE